MEDKYKEYLFEYYHDGSWWGLQIAATSEEDARTRLNKLPLAKYLGVVEMKIPAGRSRFDWFLRLVCWLRNRRVFD